MVSSLLVCSFLTSLVFAHIGLRLGNASTVSVHQIKNCDDKCYPAWKGREVAEKCKGDVVDCDYFLFGTFRPGKQCKCQEPTPTPSTTSTPTSTPTPTLSKTPRPATSCKGDAYEVCQAPSTKLFLEKFCEDGVEECQNIAGGITRTGYRCKCPGDPMPSPSPSSSPDPKCPGARFNNCFAPNAFQLLKKFCPDGVSGCKRTENGKTLFGVQCRCVIKATPSSTPTASPSASTTPRPECISSLYNFCFPLWKKPTIQKLCRAGLETCERLQSGRIVDGVRCECNVGPTPTAKAPMTPTPKPLVCPVDIDETSAVRLNEYDIDVKKTDACFNVVYSFFGQAYGLTIMYEGKTLRRIWVNSRVFAPLKLCIYGKSTNINVKYSVMPGKKIFFKISCAYKSLTSR